MFLVRSVHAEASISMDSLRRVSGMLNCIVRDLSYADIFVSTILYRTKALRRFQYYVSADWPGGNAILHPSSTYLTYLGL